VQYRTRAEERRDHRFELKLSDGERDALAAAANRSGLTLAAWLVRAGLDVAEHRMAPVGAAQREMLAELIQIAIMLNRAGATLSQAAGNLGSADTPCPNLESAAGYCMRVVRRVDDAAQLVRRRLP
jgi:hypothetical protein